MPALDAAVEFFTGVIHAIVVVLIVYRPCQAVAEHALCKWRESIDRILLQEPRGRRRVTFRGRKICIGRGTELVEFILRYT